MNVFLFVTVVQAIVAALLVVAILMQKSEGGGLGVGSGPSGFMSARGAADFMTRLTAILASLFVLLSVVLGVMAVNATAAHKIDTSLVNTAPAAAPVLPSPAPAAAPASTPAPAPAPADPLSGAAKQ
jgi:preprotein translocase subunit SecG